MASSSKSLMSRIAPGAHDLRSITSASLKLANLHMSCAHHPIHVESGDVPNVRGTGARQQLRSHSLRPTGSGGALACAQQSLARLSITRGMKVGERGG